MPTNLEIYVTLLAEDFPFRKDLGNNLFAYICPLTFGRARINVTSVGDELGVEEFY